ncbi:YbaN family protein [Bordetella sp. 2513F-2]
MSGPPPAPHRAAAPSPWKRRLYFAAGMLMLVLGLIGVVLPVMPTTIFLIAAAACFGRASPRWETCLLQHPRYGPALRAWRYERAVSTRAKCWAVAGMMLGLAVFWYGRPAPWLGVLVTLAMAACALWLVRRPTPRGQA